MFNVHESANDDDTPWLDAIYSLAWNPLLSLSLSFVFAPCCPVDSD